MESVTSARILVIVLFSVFICQPATAQDDCGYTWVTQPSRYVPGGSYDSSARSVQSCKGSCIRYANCTGFDFDGAERCWVVFNGTVSSDLNKYVTHYQRIRVTGNSSCPSDCNSGNSVAFSEHSDSHVNGGTWTTDRTLEDCAKRCLNITCRGFDWDPKNQQNQWCWISGYSTNPIQNDSSGVTHYEKLCAANGIKEEKPNSIPWNQRDASTPFPTVPTVLPQVLDAQPVVAGKYVFLKQQAIRPAYIVMAGLGGGCILLTIIAVAVLCSYPLKRNGDYIKHTKNSRDTLDRASKLVPEEEHIGMSTVTAVHASSEESRKSYESVNHRTSNGSAVAETGYVTGDENEGASHHSSYHDDANARTSGGSVRQSGYNQAESVRNSEPNENYEAIGSERQSGFNNDGYNTITSQKSGKSQTSGFANDGYNTMTSNRSHKSGYEENPYDKDSHVDRASTLERAHESIAEETDDYRNSRNSTMEGNNATYNQEDYM